MTRIFDIHWNVSRFATIAMLSIATMTVGCAPNDKPDLAVVTGTLTKNNQPFVGATVEFYPEQPGAASYGITDEEGRFTLSYSTGDPGAAPGKHTVHVIGGSVKGGSGASDNVPAEGTDDAPAMAASPLAGGPGAVANLTAEVVEGEVNDIKLTIP
ncbi:carboxypeptidase-like regulatory domain-containing protein [Novipirellula rosea]|tara:strand:+ start:5972 stop:6439 length:468 start_codon:yes stop_codon:yes gene_type:complete